MSSTPAATAPLVPLGPLGYSWGVTQTGIVSPRDPASGLPTGKRSHGIIAILIG